MPIVEVHHPLVQHHLTQLRDKSTCPTEFRTLLKRLSPLLAYEATRSLQTKDLRVETPLTGMVGAALASKIALVPILRAGLGMTDPILDLIPEAEVWHLGLYRDETTAQPVRYYNKIPQTGPVDVAFVLDPMLATGGSAMLAIQVLKNWGVPSISLLSVIASREGVETVNQRFPETNVFVCAIDAELNEHKYIVPGLGDAGDRAFNTLRYLS